MNLSVYPISSSSRRCQRRNIILVLRLVEANQVKVCLKCQVGIKNSFLIGNLYQGANRFLKINLRPFLRHFKTDFSEI